MALYFLSFWCRTVSLVSIFSLMFAVSVASMDKDQSKEYEIRTIIFNKRMVEETQKLHRDEEKYFQYTDAFGIDSIFKVVETNERQKEIAKKMMNFDSDICSLGIHQNYIIVSLSIGNLFVNVPHLFFSGNIEETCEHVFINVNDVLDRSSRVTTQGASSSYSIIKKTFITGSSPSDYAKERTLQFMMANYFPDMFYGLDHPEFFVFPIHQPHLNSEHSLSAPEERVNRRNTQNRKPSSAISKEEENEYTEEHCKKPSTESDLTDNKPEHSSHLNLTNQADLLTCTFRDFIYAHFTEGKEAEIEKQLEGEDFELTLQILGNIITHANRNRNSQTIPAVQRSIMRSVFAERYIRKNAYSQKVLSDIFGLNNFDVVFGKTGKEFHTQLASTSEISKCFLHSEQSYLKKMILRQINIKDFIIDYMYESLFNCETKCFGKFNVEKDSSKSVLDVGLLVASQGDLKPIEEDVDIDDCDDSNVGVDQESTISEISLDQHDVLQFTFDNPIIIDIFSPRHICKFCRGSLCLRHNDIEKLFRENITILPIPIEEKTPNSLNSQSNNLAKIIKLDIMKNVAKEHKHLTKEERDKIAQTEYNTINEKIMGRDTGGKNINKKPSLDTHGKMYEYCQKFRNKGKEYAQFVTDYQKMTIHKKLMENYHQCGLNNNFVIRLSGLDISILATSFKDADSDIM